MSNYTQITDFSAKDALPSGNPSKLVLGSEFDAEFDAISTAIGTKFDSTSVATTGEAQAETLNTKIITPLRLASWSDANAGVVGDLQALTDPNEDSLAIWDDSAGAMAWVSYVEFSSADASKLDGIEAGATADQSNAEIKTAYESNANTNAFTDAEQTKLSGIEAAATADQSASEIRTLVEAASDSNVFTDADHTKLNGIEASATADQTDAEIRDAVIGALDINTNTTLDGTDTERVILLSSAADLTLNTVGAENVGRVYHVIGDSTSGVSAIFRGASATMYSSTTSGEITHGSNHVSLSDRAAATITVIAANTWHVSAPLSAVVS